MTPPLFRQIVRIPPSPWAVRAYEDILARGTTLHDVLPSVAGLLDFACVFTLAGMLRFRRATA